MYSAFGLAEVFEFKIRMLVILPLILQIILQILKTLCILTKS